MALGGAGVFFMGQGQSFFVRVDGRGDSVYRSPKGVYHIELNQVHTSERVMARAVLDGATQTIPFLKECVNSCTMRLFTSAGEEISITGLPGGCDELSINQCERVRSFPLNITEH